MAADEQPTTRTSRPPGGRRALFIEPWWLDVVAEGAWDAVSVSLSDRARGWLPFVRSRRMGFAHVGLPPLTRLIFPIVDLAVDKRETYLRTRIDVESELIRQLPEAGGYEFVLPPDLPNALAWQLLGFDARIQHTFLIAPGTSRDEMWQQMNHKTRNLVRRAEETLAPRELDGEAFAHEFITNFGEDVEPEHAARVQRLASEAMNRGAARAIGVVDPAGVVHAATLFVWDATDYYYFLSTRNTKAAALGAVSLLVWLGMNDAMARGLRFDFDGVSSSNRLQFLQSFGGHLASRIVLTRAHAVYEARLLLRYARRQGLTANTVERFP